MNYTHKTNNINQYVTLLANKSLVKVISIALDIISLKDCVDMTEQKELMKTLDIDIEELAKIPEIKLAASEMEYKVNVLGLSKYFKPLPDGFLEEIESCYYNN